VAAWASCCPPDWCRRWWTGAGTPGGQAGWCWLPPRWWRWAPRSPQRCAARTYTRRRPDGCFGAGYIAYITFIVAYLKADGAGPHTIAGFWAVLGAAGVITGFAWGPVLNALRVGHGLSVVLALTTLGAVLPPALAGSRTADYVSAVCFGGSFLAVVTAVTHLTRRGLPPAQVPAGIAIATVCFSVGQAVGPVLAGALSQGASGTRAGLWLGVAFLGAGSVVALVQEELGQPPVIVSQKAPPGDMRSRPAERIYL
jgi:hypothetical protein